jgi:hypothetical protein
MQRFGRDRAVWLRPDQPPTPKGAGGPLRSRFQTRHQNCALAIFVILSSAALYYYMPARSRGPMQGGGGVSYNPPINYQRPSGTSGAWGGAAEVGVGGVGSGSGGGEGGDGGGGGGGSQLGEGSSSNGRGASSSSSGDGDGDGNSAANKPAGDKSKAGSGSGGSAAAGGGTPRARRNSGQGTGASRNLPFLNEAAVQRAIAAASKDSPEGALRTHFKGSFVMHAKRRHVDEVGGCTIARKHLLPTP